MKKDEGIASTYIHVTHRGIEDGHAISRVSIVGADLGRHRDLQFYSFCYGGRLGPRLPYPSARIAQTRRMIP